MGEHLDPMPLEEYGIEIDIEDMRSQAEIDADCADNGFDNFMSDAVQSDGLEQIKEKIRNGELDGNDKSVKDKAVEAIMAEAQIRGYESCDDRQQPAHLRPNAGISI